MFDVRNLKAIRVGLASPERIREWSHGEVINAETLDYRSQKPKPGGLFCEKIFGPSKDYQCYCGRYKKIRYAGQVCERCGVEITSKDVRRERMGHIELASPCTHIWYLKGIPSRISLILDIPPKALEEIVYFVAHVCLNGGTSTILEPKQVFDEKTAREVFPRVIEEFCDKLDPESADYEIAQDLIEKMGNSNEAFNFFDTAAFISKHTGAEFGEGAQAIKELLKKVDLDEEFYEIESHLVDAKKQNRQNLLKRLQVIEAFRNSHNRPEWMVLDVLPVIPPDLRPMLQLDGGRYAASDLNDLYRRVITRNMRLKRLIDIKAPNVILINEKRMLQEAVDALIDNGRRNKPVTGTGGRPLKSLSASLQGKPGRFRQNLLGKRVDYSGRSVIAVGPDLKMYQCGLPREMAIQLFRPFIAQILIKRGLANTSKLADKLIDRYDSVVYDVIEEIIGDHPVLLNRAPTLHRLGIQAFQPKLVDGRAIRLHPLVCTGFNADFDGDQMAVHVPLSKEAQWEALNLMLASNNILGPKDGKPIVTPSQDMVLGNYYLTLEETKDELLSRAKRREEKGDYEEAELYEIYGNSEGKVFKDINEVILAYQTKQIHLHNRVAIKAKNLHKTGLSERMENGYLITTVGKAIFNLIFPADFPYLNRVSAENLKNNIEEDFVDPGTDIREYIANKPILPPFKKGDLGKIIDEVFRRYGTSKTSAVLDKMKDNGFRYSTVAGVTISISDIKVLENKAEIIAETEKIVEKYQERYDQGLSTEEERHKDVCSTWEKVTNQIEDLTLKQFERNKRNPVFIMKDSGARGNASQFRQLAGMRGLMRNPKGETIELPIRSCLREGLTVSEFFIATHGARKGGADTALKTADSGYLTRRLVDVAQDVIVREEDCHTDHGFVVKDIIGANNKVIVKLKERLIGRYSLRPIVDPKTKEVIVEGNTLISEKDAQKVIDAGIKEVEIRSLFACQTRDGVCKHCYGLNLATGKVVEVGEAVGIMAAQSIGEPGTQLTMRTFHTGGVAGGGDITQGLPRVAELVEARSPKGKAIIAEFSGKVTNVTEENGIYSVTIENSLEKKVYETNYGAYVLVKKGDKVENGDKITEGAISPKELLAYGDENKVQNYMLQEIQKVYRDQEISISDKHIEVIVRQMLKKIVVVDGGDTELVPGAFVDYDDFTSINQPVLLEGKRPAVGHQLILGITKAALGTKSFLSAASFQETTRVLTDASIKGKVDILHGLKENVITGKLIPAGTGLWNEDTYHDHLDDFTVAKKMEEVRGQYIESHDRQED